MDDYGLTNVVLQSVGYEDDQWVLASHYEQVAYYALPKESKKDVVVSRKVEDCGSRWSLEPRRIQQLR